MILRLGVLIFVDLLLEFLDRGFRYSLLGAIFLPVPRQNLISTTFFLTLTCPPVALDAPAKILRHYWVSFTVSYVGVLGEGFI